MREADRASKGLAKSGCGNLQFGELKALVENRRRFGAPADISPPLGVPLAEDLVGLISDHIEDVAFTMKPLGTMEKHSEVPHFVSTDRKTDIRATSVVASFYRFPRDGKGNVTSATKHVILVASSLVT